MSRGTGIGIAVVLAGLLLIAIMLLSRPTDSPVRPSVDRPANGATPTPAAEPVQAQPASSAARADEARPSLPASFQLASDFHAFAIQALGSGDGGGVFEGFQALRECEGMQQFADDLRIVADGGGARGMVHGDVTEERRKAIRDVLRRCEGFSKIDYRERRALYSAFQKRGQELGAVEFSTAARPWGQFTREELVGLLASTSAAARHLGLLALAEEAGRARPEDPDAAKAFDTRRSLGFLLAGCDLGGHCGPGTYQSEMQCAQVGRCGQALLDGWQDGLDPAQIEQVEALRRKVLDAIATRDYARLAR